MRTVEKWIGLACGLNTFTQYPCRSFELRISLTGLLCIYKWIHLLGALYGDHLDLQLQQMGLMIVIIELILIVRHLFDNFCPSN